MKIDNTTKTPGAPSESRPRAPQRPATAEAGAAATPSKVQLSAFASNLQKLEAAMADTPVVDSGKVAEIKSAIAQGQFRVDPEKVADSLLSSVRQMLGAQTTSA